MSPAIKSKWAAYPKNAQKGLKTLRVLLLSVADELGNAADLQETLKWNQASYAYPGGSSVRIDWKSVSPNSIWLYFHCQCQLVATFRELYPDTFTYHGNRALELSVAGDWDAAALKKCLRLAMTYQRCKHLPLLGEAMG